MDKYPYFTDEICINTTKPLVFVHFFILAQQTSLHNGEGETVSYSSPFPCFLQEDWQIKCNLFYLNLFKVIPIKSGHGHFGQNQNKKIISRLKIVYINNINYLYILSLELFSHQKTNLTEMTMTEFDRDFVLHFDNCPGKISHFVSLSFCVIFVFERKKCSI